MFRPSAASAKMRNGIRIALEPVLVADDRHDQESEQQDQGDADAILADRKDLLVGGVRVLELPGVAVEHVSRRPQ